MKPMSLFIFTETPTLTEVTCSANQFQCQSGVCTHHDDDDCEGPCIPNNWVKDGAEDCSDGSDEREYSI